MRLEASVDAARQHDVKLNAWTVDDPKVIVEFAATGVEAIITNTPDIARAALARSDG